VPVRPAASAEAKPSRDAIGDLIRTGEPGTRPPANVGEPGRVAAAQRALIKLGYGPLKADGVMGAGTRQALERFEKDRRLPVTGELAARTVRDLAAQSGIGIE
jgi:peptidoglycan hydrolase-like protein with peptidoglycan-binding domain